MQFISNEDAIDSLIRCNSSLGFIQCDSPDFNNCIKSTHCPNSIMKITDVKKCRSGNFRVIVMMNKVMHDFLKKQQIKVLNTICQLYPIIFRNRSSNCHLPGHFKSQCTSPVICSFCGGNHHPSN